MYKGKHYVGEVIIYYTGETDHECIVTAVWEDEGRNGITIRPTGNYGFEIDIYEDDKSAERRIH